MTVHSQTWNGTYIVDSSCNVGACCCLSNEIIVTVPTSNLLAFNTSLNGICFGYTYLAGTVVYPNGYTFSITLSIITLRITLSSDSSTLTIANSLSSSCNGKAVRAVTIIQTSTVHSNAVRQYMNILMLLSLALSSSVLNI